MCQLAHLGRRSTPARSIRPAVRPRACKHQVPHNYYLEGRAKIVMFPKDPVCDNLYHEILEWPRRWRDYVCVRRRVLVDFPGTGDANPIRNPSALGEFNRADVVCILARIEQATTKPSEISIVLQWLIAKLPSTSFGKRLLTIQSILQPHH